MRKSFKLLACLLLVSASISLYPKWASSVVTNTATSTTTALGNGVTTDYVISFDFRDNTQITVSKVNTSTGVSTTISQGAGAGKFTVIGGNPGTTVRMGTAPTSSEYLIIRRSIPLTQPVVFDPAQAFPITDLGTQLDQMTMNMQTFNDSLTSAGISTGNSSGSSSSGLSTLPTIVANNFIGYNAAGTSTVTFPGTSAISSGDILKFNGSNWATYNLSSNINTLVNSGSNLVQSSYGGTGVSNGGTLTWGSNPLAFTLTGSTNVTLPTSGTLLSGTASSANTANNIVSRDGSGNFAATTVTANLTGNVTGNLTGNVTGNTSGTAANVTGTVAIGNGGTGQTTAANAITALTGTQTSGYFLRSNGTNSLLAPIAIGDVPQGFSRLKLAQDTPNTVVINDGSGNLGVVAGTAAGQILTYNGLTWGASALYATGSITRSSLQATTPYAVVTNDAAGIITDSPSYTWNGGTSTLSLQGTLNVVSADGFAQGITAPASSGTTHSNALPLGNGTLLNDVTYAQVGQKDFVDNTVSFYSAGAGYTQFNHAGSTNNSASNLIFNNSYAANYLFPQSGGSVVTTQMFPGGIRIGNASGIGVSVVPTGDVTFSVAGVTAIGTNKVQNTQLAQMGASTIKGNNTLSTGTALDLTGASVVSLLADFGSDHGSGGSRGLVPLPPAGTGTSKFLSSSGGWSTVTATAAASPTTYTGYNVVIGSAADVTANNATHSTFASYTQADGDRILVLPTYATSEAWTITKKLFIHGFGDISNISGAITLNAGSTYTKIENVRTTSNMTISSNVIGVMASGIWFSGSNTFVDNNTSTVNLLQGMQE